MFRKKHDPSRPTGVDEQPDDGRLIQTAEQFARLREFGHAWPLVHELLNRNPAPPDGQGPDEALIVARVRALLCFVTVFAAQARADAVVQPREEEAGPGRTSRVPDWGRARAALAECDRHFDLLDTNLQCGVLTYRGMIARVVDGDIEESLRLLGRCVELQPIPEHIVNLAMAHQSAGNHHQAVELMRPVMQTSAKPDFFAFVISQAMQAGLSDDVERYAELAVARLPTSGWAHGMRFQARAFLGVRRGDEDAMLEDAAWALDDPHTPEPVSTYIKAWIRRAEDTAVEHVDALVDQGYAEYQVGNLDSARDFYQQAVAAGDVTAMVLLGALEGESGDTDLARNWFHRAIEQGDDIDAMVNLGSLEEYLGNLDTAREWLGRAAERDSAEGLFSLGELEQRAGNADAARLHLTRAAEMGHEEAAAALHALGDG